MQNQEKLQIITRSELFKEELIKPKEVFNFLIFIESIGDSR